MSFSICVFSMESDGTQLAFAQRQIANRRKLAAHLTPSSPLRPIVEQVTPTGNGELREG
jgi:hypothetical protein